MRKGIDDWVSFWRHNFLLMPQKSRGQWVVTLRASRQLFTMRATLLPRWLRYVAAAFFLPIALLVGWGAVVATGISLLDRAFLGSLCLGGVVLSIPAFWYPDFRVSLVRLDSGRVVAAYCLPQGIFRRPTSESESLPASECMVAIQPPDELELEEASRLGERQRYVPQPDEHWATLILGERRILLARGSLPKMREQVAVEKLAAFGVPVREATVRRAMPEL